ncbi:MAG: DUF1127 domain-containing protein [Proteobacteria bacterium]|nr:DUF1127 domain-containing protein [Pseudomonadota bacterium]
MQSQTNAIAYAPRFRRISHPMHGLSLVRHVLGVIRQRRRLARLSDTQLADIGITREQAMTEAARPFWDLPVGQINLSILARSGLRSFPGFESP